MNWNRWTIRWRLTIWNSVVLTLLFCVFSMVMLFAVHEHLLHQADLFLKEELQELLEDLRGIDDTSTLSSQLKRRYAVHTHYHFQIVDAQGETLFRSRFLTQIQLPRPALPSEMRGQRYEDVDLPVGKFRLLTMAIRNSRSEPLLLQVVTPRSALYQEFSWYLGTLLTFLPIAVIVSLVTGHLLARRALAPLERMADTAKRISAENLTQRLEVGHAEDELGRLAATLNGMFDRLRVSMTQMKQFTSDAAHELRSPIAALRARAEIALRVPRSLEEYHRIVEETLEDTHHMGELVDQLLLLSRHDSGQQTAMFDEMRVDVLLLDVVDRFRPVASDKDLQLEQTEFPPWTVKGDDVWLSLLFWNLLDNAGKYTLAGGTIRVSAHIVGDQWCCSIQDTGMGIEEIHLSRIFDRFYRVDESRTRTAGGTGLGLAICKSIVEAHQGQIQVTSEIGTGSVFTVILPGRLADDDIEPVENESQMTQETGTA